MIRRDVALPACGARQLGQGDLHRSFLPETPGAGAAGARLGTDAWRSGNVARGVVAQHCREGAPSLGSGGGGDIRQSFLPRKFPEIPRPRR